VGGVVHYGVANMPALVPRTSTFALTNATLPYVIELATRGAGGAARANPFLAKGINVWHGKIVHPGVAEASPGKQENPNEQNGLHRQDRFQQLARLLPSQFERVVFEMRIPEEYLPIGSASQVERAIAIIRWAEQIGDLKRLDTAIAYSTGVADRRWVLDALMRLPPSQFEEVIFRAGVPIGELPSHTAPQATRAIAATKWAETNAFLDRLASAIVQAEDRAEEGRKLQEKIESSALNYVEDTVADVKNRMERDRQLSYACYAIGLLSFVAGVLFAYSRFQSHPANTDYPALLIFLSTSVLVVVMLIGTTRYSFVIGRSFMEQSLRGMDRMHAIRFGIFYLKAAGDRFDWNELKEAFQHWNIDKAGPLPQPQTAEFDPKFAEQATELIKALASLKPGK